MRCRLQALSNDYKYTMAEQNSQQKAIRKTDQQAYAEPAKKMQLTDPRYLRIIL